MTTQAKWRLATPCDDSAIAAMFGALNHEDPGLQPVSVDQIFVTLERLRTEPIRGRAVVLECNEILVGYALLIAFWSNELGGEVCHIDEIYVAPAHRRRQHATALIEQLKAGNQIWATDAAALELEVSSSNPRAASLYRRLGFKSTHNQHLRLYRQR